MSYRIVEIDGLQIDPATGRIPVEIMAEPHAINGVQHIGVLDDNQIPTSIMRVVAHQEDPHTMPIDGRVIHIDGQKLDTIEEGAQKNNLTNQQALSLTSGAHSSWHTHDDFYYRKTTLGLAHQAVIHWDNLIAVPLEFNPTSHNHNDLYYLKSEIDTNLYTKLELDGGQLDNRYYTKTDLENIIAAYYTKQQLDNGQLDSRYYTETETDVLFNKYFTKIELNAGQLNNLYYTEYEIDNMLANYYNRAQLDSGRLDNRYYTETEIDSQLALYYSSSLLDGGQLDNRYYTKSNITTILGSYYTSTQIDTTLSDYYTKANLQTSGQAQVHWGNLTAVPTTFTPPVASTTILGGVKQGANVTISATGVISVAAPYVLPISTATVLGGVKKGTNISIDAAGVISVASFPWSGITGSPTTIAGYGIVLTNTNITTALGFTPVNTTLVGAVNGIATLDGSGRLTTAQIPSSLIGALVYQGVWNASTNSPTLTTGVGVKGQYYKVSTAGTASLDGNAFWEVGDMVIYNGATWDRVEGGVTDVTSVFGRVGAISLLSSDVTGALGFTPYNATNPDGYITSATLPVASATVFGSVKIGTGINVAAGVISVTPYTLPVATAAVLGGVKQGSNITIAGDGTISATNPYALPIATATILGGVKIGSGIAVDAAGLITVAFAGSGTAITTSHSDHTHTNDATIGGPFYTQAQLNAGQLNTLYNTKTEIVNYLASKSDIGHIHDDRYYTQTQITAFLAGKSDTTHTHDTRYYTQAQIDTNFYTKTQLNNGQLNILYNTKSEITNYLALKSDIGHDHNSLYFTQSQVNGFLALKSDVGHTHDDRYFTQSYVTTNYFSKNDLTGGSLDVRYYTETEVDAKIAAIQTFGIKGAVDTYALLPAALDGEVWIVRNTVGSNQEGFYQHKNGVWNFLANNTGATTHNALGGLNVGDYMHLTAIQYAGLTGGSTTSLHNHDGSYYTKTFVDSTFYTKSALNAGQLDSRYFTESEITTTLTEYYTKTQLDAGQLDNRYYTQVQITAYLAGKSDTSHTHDTRYYTQAQIDTSLALKSDVGHTHDDRYFTSQYITTNYYTQAQVDAKIGAIQASSIKGAVDQYEDLPTTASNGDLYIVRAKESIPMPLPGTASITTSDTVVQIDFENTVIDVKGHTIQAVPGNNPAVYVTGKVGKALQLNAGYVTLPNSPDFDILSQTVTLGGWVYSMDEDQQMAMFDKLEPSGSGYNGYGLMLTGKKAELWAGSPTQGFKKATTYSILKPLTWTHIGLTYDGTMFKVYKNGIIVQQLSFPGPIPVNTRPIDIGRYFNTYFNGYIDQFFVSKRVYSESDMQKLVNNNALFSGYNTEGFYQYNSVTGWKWIYSFNADIFHNQLQGINTEDTYHVTKSQYNTLTGSGDASAIHHHDSYYYRKSLIDTSLSLKSDTGHNHDDRYYTQTQITSYLSGKADVTHNHNTLYYTQAQVDTFIASKANAVHTHDDRYFTTAQITANYYSQSQLNGGQLDSRYYTESEITAYLAGKSDAGHTHDDRYYTETQTNTLLAGKSDTTHTHDTRYYTQTQTDSLLAAKANSVHDHNAAYYLKSELNSTTATSGASLIGINSIVGMVSTTVQAAIAELKTAVSALPTTLNASYTGGRAITMSAAGQAVKIDSNASTAAPLELSNRTVTPTTDLQGGQMAVINSEFYIYRLDKAKWLTPSKIITFGKSGYADGHSLEINGVRNDSSGHKMIKNGTIVGVSLSNVLVVANKEVYLRVNGVTKLTMLTDSTGNYIGDTNIDFVKGDLISIKVSATGTPLQDTVVDVEISWRA
jgi:hypothetical protein